MNGFILVLPLLVIRFIVMGYLNKEALQSAVHFAPLLGNEKLAYYLYQLANVSLIISPCFTKVNLSTPLVYMGVAIYFIGALLVLISTINFAIPKGIDFKTQGIYKFSRNPMYVGFFFYFLGCALLTYSTVLMISLFLFQLSAHWIILAEERWCEQKFGEEYLAYQKRVRRYL